MTDWFSVIWKHFIVEGKLIACIPFLMIRTKDTGRIEVNFPEVLKTLLTAAIIAAVVGYGTIRVMEREIERVISRLDKLDAKLGIVDDLAKRTSAEREVRRSEIDRRLDMLERKK
jgi:hypothetical protein